jgi:hypothetical protein
MLNLRGVIFGIVALVIGLAAICAPIAVDAHHWMFRGF